MLIKKRPSWAMAEADATSEHIYLNRREWLRAAGFAGLGPVSYTHLTLPTILLV